MSASSSSRFGQQARAIIAQEDAAKASQLAAEQTAEQRRARIAAEGPAAAQTYVKELVQKVREEILAVNQLFTLPSASQKGADVEVVVREKWLITGQLEGDGDFVINVYDLVAQNNPRMREQSGSLDRVKFRIALNQQNGWVWKTNGGSKSTSVTVFAPEIHTASELTNEALAEHFLDKVLALAQEQKPRSGNAFHVL